MTLEEIKKEINLLPAGYISTKNIRGKITFYHQWMEDGKLKSKYLRDEEKAILEEQISERRYLEQELRVMEHKINQDNRMYAYYRKFCLERKISVGAQSFESIISNKYFYVDKSEFIYQWWNDPSETTLITRPRRFGKTLNMSMLNTFFSKTYEGRMDLFEDLSVWKHKRMRELQGKYSVINMTFGGIKSGDPDGQKLMMKHVISSVYDDYYNLFMSLEDKQRAYYTELCFNDQFSDERAARAIYDLSKLLFEIDGQKVIILLDEYDTPLLEAYVNGYWRECSKFLRMFFNYTFKTNPYVIKSLMTGITRISKESFFSDLNNIVVASMTSNLYSDSFGFTEKEVFEAMDAQHLKNKDEVKSWYDGYNIGNKQDIYNPWSVTCFLSNAKIAPYWSNSGSNKLISEIFQRGSIELKYALEDLIEGRSVSVEMRDELNFSDIETDNDAFWNLLLNSGYVKIVDENNGNYEVAATNREVRDMLRSFTTEWLQKPSGKYNAFIRALLKNDIEHMNHYLSKFVIDTFSYFDTTEDCEEPERFYHGFVLGLIYDLQDRFIITSNRESGFGRFDAILEPRNRESDDAYIFEFKTGSTYKKSSLEELCKDALKQIDENRYSEGLIARGISTDRIHSYGFGFIKKQVLIME